MIIQHNIMAINSHRQLGINNTNLSKNLEKLSSGYRINRAADDAAGLAISEKMRAQITGLDRAILNAQDGASLIQTAEGALAEVHSMLNRMVELATQSANGTIQASDRQKIEAETTALKDEIDRISKATNFNGINLLDGSLSSNAPKDISVKNVKVNETAAMAGIYKFAKVDEDTATNFADLKAGDILSFTVSTKNGTTGTSGDSFTINFQVTEDGKQIRSIEDGTVYDLTANGTTYEWKNTDAADAVETQLRLTKLNDNFIINKSSDGKGLELTSRTAGTAAAQVTGIGFTKNNAAAVDIAMTTPVSSNDPTTNTVAKDEVSSIATANFTVFNVDNNVTNEDRATFEINGQKFVLVNEQELANVDEYAKEVAKLENRGVNIIRVGGATSGDLTSADLKRIAADINQKTGLAFEYDTSTAARGLLVKAPQVGNGLTMQVGDTAADFNKITVSVDDMSSMGLGINNISMASQESASRALDRINAAIEKVSVNRGNLGALQNRLTYTINNLGVTTENMTAAESRIRDVDMAKEMMAFTKNNVLSQAAQAMLAQANMQPQQVLQLLR
ncbi:MAG: flagellin [Oscillospiraceae bacterium]